MAKNNKCEELPKGNRRNNDEINQCNLLRMITKETLPGLQWPTLPRRHVDRNRRLRDIDAQLEQLSVDPGSAPQRISQNECRTADCGRKATANFSNGRRGRNRDL